MKLAISNIAWSEEDDSHMYSFLAQSVFSGLEIAPTRLVPDNPYDHPDNIQGFKKSLQEEYNLEICSMQSIWYGRNEELFGSENERDILMEYTKKAILFARDAGCSNLVFGSPRNRRIQSPDDYGTALDIFAEWGGYAAANGTVISMEPNPVLYGTNFINTTQEAFQIVKEVECEGFRVNIDLGTIIENGETLDDVLDNINLVNHIHISEPQLATLRERSIHRDLLTSLSLLSYDRYISIEMRNPGNLDEVKRTMDYMGDLYGQC